MDRAPAPCESPGRQNALQRICHMLPIALLVVVATCQIALVQVAGLSPWSGGGFGMFSTLDHGSQRHLHAFLVRPGLRREVLPPASLVDAVKRALTLPTDARLHALAGALAEIPTPDHGDATAVQVQVWRTRFDSETLAPTSHILRDYVVPLDTGR
jgi:hypothetical protein